MVEAKIKIDEETARIYTFVTNIRIKTKNVGEIISFGRSRWKIENEGFNNQKTKRYAIEHANSKNYNAMKNHYLMAQLADILRQLFEMGVKKIRDLKKTIKEISSCLLESLRNRSLTETEDILQIAKRIQIRFT